MRWCNALQLNYEIYISFGLVDAYVGRATLSHDRFLCFRLSQIVFISNTPFRDFGESFVTIIRITIGVVWGVCIWLRELVESGGKRLNFDNKLRKTENQKWANLNYFLCFTYATQWILAFSYFAWYNSGLELNIPIFLLFLITYERNIINALVFAKTAHSITWPSSASRYGCPNVVVNASPLTRQHKYPKWSDRIDAMYPVKWTYTSFHPL